VGGERDPRAIGGGERDRGFGSRDRGFGARDGGFSRGRPRAERTRA
jgi:hypothetical protein